MPEGAIMLHFVSARGVCGTHLAIIESIIEKPTVFRSHVSLQFIGEILSAHSDKPLDE